MVRVKTTDKILSIHGRCGGNYFKTEKGQIHLQRMPRHVRRAHSPAALPGINRFSGVAAIWGLLLMAGFWLAWQAFAAIYTFVDDDGNEKQITGYNWYIYYAMLLPEEERLPYWKPPHSPGELPEYIASYKGIWTFNHAEEDWPAHSPSDYYWPRMEWNGKPAYGTDDNEWFLWWNGTEWIISPGFDYEPLGLTWHSGGDNIQGWYTEPVSHDRTHVYIGYQHDDP